MASTRRIKNASRRTIGRMKVAAGRIGGRRRTMIRGRADQAKADLRDDTENVRQDAKDVRAGARKTKRRLRRR
jgi:uncharacterized protein YjbJ (UPF0337 family)